MLIVRDVSDLQELTVYAQQKVSYGRLQEILITELINKLGEITQRIEYGDSTRSSRNHNISKEL
jgi:hypothetical protein